MAHQLSSAYRQNNYMGESTISGASGDTDILTFIQNNKWDTTEDGLGDPREGMTYYNTADDEFKYYNGTNWVVLTTGGSLSLADVLAVDNITDGNNMTVSDGDTLTIAVDGGSGGGVLSIAGTATVVSGGTLAIASGGDLTIADAPSSGTDATNKDYVDSVSQGLDWQDSIIDELTAAPATPTSGDRYIVDDVGNADITGVDTTADEFTVAENLSVAIATNDIIRVVGSTGNDRWYTVSSVSGTGPTTIAVTENITDSTTDGTIYYGTTADTWITASGGGPGKIAEYNGSSWDYYPSSSTAVAIEEWEGAAAWDETADNLLVFNGTSWVKFGSTITHSNLNGLLAAPNPHEVTLTQAYQGGNTIDLASGVGDLTVAIETGADFIVDDGIDTYFKTLIESSTVQLGSTGVNVDIIATSTAAVAVGGTTYATFNADGLTLQTGASITEFSTDGTLGGNSDDAVPTEKAVKTYVDDNISTETLQTAYENGSSITLDDTNGDLTFTVDETATVHDFVLNGANNYLATDAANTQLELGSAGGVTVGFLGSVDTDIAFDGTARAITNDSANLTISTTTTGDVVINAASNVDIDGSALDADFTGIFAIDGSGDSHIYSEYSVTGTITTGLSITDNWGGLAGYYGSVLEATAVASDDVGVGLSAVSSSGTSVVALSATGGDSNQIQIGVEDTTTKQINIGCDPDNSYDTSVDVKGSDIDIEAYISTNTIGSGEGKVYIYGEKSVYIEGDAGSGDTGVTLESNAGDIDVKTTSGGDLRVRTVATGDVLISTDDVSGGDIKLTSEAGAVTFQDTNQTSAIPLSDTDDGLNTSATGIVDAINELQGTDNAIDNVPYVTTAGGNPNGTVNGDAGDIYIDGDNNDVIYMNTDGTNSGWVVIG